MNLKQLAQFAVISVALFVQGCSWVAPQATIAKEQARITDTLERQVQVLERIASALEKQAERPIPAPIQNYFPPSKFGEPTIIPCANSVEKKPGG